MGELLGVVAAVKADGHAFFDRFGSFGQNDLGKGLSGVADDMDIHVVEADAHGAPQAGGAELQRGEEAGFDLLFVVCNALKLGFLFCAEGRGSQPFLIGFTVGHGIGPPFHNMVW